MSFSGHSNAQESGEEDKERVHVRDVTKKKGSCNTLHYAYVLFSRLWRSGLLRLEARLMMLHSDE